MHINLTVVFITLAILQVSANSYAQKITLDQKSASLTEIFKEIRNQSGYDFFYDEKLVQNTKLVDIQVKNASIEKVLDQCFEGQNLVYTINDQIVVVKQKAQFHLETAMISKGALANVIGKVVDEKGAPLPGATIKLKGTNRVVLTDVDGIFNLQMIDENAILEVSYTGFEPQEVAVGGKGQLMIVLKESLSKLDEVVVIAYGAVRKSDLTGSVGQVDLQDLSKAPVGNFAEALAGRVAGVQVISSDGQPGGGIEILIRGAGSLTQSTSPLYVIDGFPVEDLDPSTLNTDDIASLTVLKDASSTAIYGSRAANGVVLIQTKRGKVGKAVVSFNTSFGSQLQGKEMELMSPYEFLKYQLELNPTLPTTKSYFENGKTLEDYRDVKGINWGDQVITNGAVQNYSLALRGGNDETQYAISGSLYDQTGLVINTGYDRYSGRVTLDQKVSERVKTGVTVNYSGVKTNGQVINTGAGTTNPSSYALYRTWAYRPIHGNENVDLLTEEVDADAINTSELRVNPLIDLENQHQINVNKALDGNAYISLSLLNGLTLKSTAGFRHLNRLNERYYNSKTSQGSPRNPNNLNGINGSIGHMQLNSFSNENTLTWVKEINTDHKVTGLGLFSLNQTKTQGDGYSGRLLPNENLGMDGLDEGLSFRPTSYNSENSMVSYATRWDYSFKSKYLLTLNFRADASSKFVNPWGYFPGAAVAWNMDQEDFFTNLFPFVSSSKLRASYGSTGNNRVGDFATYASLVQSLNGYSLNNETPVGSVYADAMGNRDLKWEKVNTIDLGYELSMFKNKINLEVDLYRRVTEDLLLAATLPPTIGFSSAMKNIGKLKNEGLEITVNTINIENDGFRWTSNFNIGFNKNTIMKLADGEQGLPTSATFESQFNKPLYLAEVGNAAGMMIGFVWDGNYQYEDFHNPSPGIYLLKNTVPTNGAIRNTIQPGDIKYKDINGDGIVNDYDMTFIGRGQPMHTGGFSNNFSYKGFDLNVFLQWSYGNDVYNANRLSLEGNSNNRSYMNQFASYVNRWSPENQTNANYRTRGQGPIGFHSSRVVESGSYLRLKTVSLSYSIPQRYLKPLYLTNLSLNVAAQNLLTWTDYSGVDPEVSTRNPILSPGFDFSAYPQAKTIVIGLKAAF